jgi:hypothetical protein
MYLGIFGWKMGLLDSIFLTFITYYELNYYNFAKLTQSDASDAKIQIILYHYPFY